jgi:hypothetical protein
MTHIQRLQAEYMEKFRKAADMADDLSNSYGGETLAWENGTFGDATQDALIEAGKTLLTSFPNQASANFGLATDIWGLPNDINTMGSMSGTSQLARGVETFGSLGLAGAEAGSRAMGGRGLGRVGGWGGLAILQYMRLYWQKDIII